MKTTTSLTFATVAALAAILSASAQPGPAVQPDEGAGLLGRRFTGVEYGYTHHVESAPRSLNRFGFISQAPLPELENLDGAFRYNYIRGSAGGIVDQTHDVRAGLVRYFSHQGAKPFAEAQLGWAFRRVGSNKDNSFVYRLGAGLELPVNPVLALTPFVGFEDTHYSDGVWSYGARLCFRPHRDWSATLGVQLDDGHNIEYALGIQRRY